MEFQVRYLILWLRLILDKKSWKKYPVNTNAVNAVIRFSLSWIPALHGVNPSLKKTGFWMHFTLALLKLIVLHLPCIVQINYLHRITLTLFKQTTCIASPLHCSNKLITLHHPCIVPTQGRIREIALTEG